MSKKFIPYGRQWIDTGDIREVVKTLKSDWLTEGPAIERFEKAFAEYCGAPYGVAVSSGTAGLHLACLAARFKEGDEVITTPLTFVATANSILYTGARPRFVDIDPQSLNLDTKKIPDALRANTRGLISVDFSGQPCQLGPKQKFSRQKDFIVIEDACHALGAEVNDGGRWSRVGSCRESDMTVFSFHPVKHMTTGEGGMVTTRNKSLYETLKRLRSHGIERNPNLWKNPPEKGNSWYYEMQALGFNYRITDLQSALGWSQLKKVESFVNRRREIAELYDRAFYGVAGIEIPAREPSTRSSFHLYTLRIHFKQLGLSRVSLMGRLRKKQIGTQVHYIPVHLQPYYQERFGYRSSDFPESKKYYEEALSIPLYPAMKNTDIQRVIRGVLEATGRRLF